MFQLSFKTADGCSRGSDASLLLFSQPQHLHLTSKFIGGTFKTHWKQRCKFNIFLYRANFGKNSIWSLQEQSWDFYFPLPSWHNSAAELIWLRLSKQTWRGSRHMIFHTKRSLFLKGESSWEGAGSRMLGCVLPLRGRECLPGGEKEKRESGCDGRVGSPVGWVSAPGVHCVPCVTPCLPPPVLVASAALTPWACVQAEEGQLKAPVVWSEHCLSFLPFIPSSLLPFPSLPGPLHCELVPCVFWALLWLCNVFHRGYSG